ncbi:MAG TPA: DinB family protein [Thermoanaerobaculia bacterium]
MLAGTVRQLLLYTLWADRICLKAVEAVRPEDLRRETGTSFGSLFGTLAHILGAERRWLSRFEGKLLDIVDTSDFADWEALTASWGETAAEMNFFLASLTAEQLAAELTWTSTEGDTYTRPLWLPVLHLVNHSTYHRGQVVSLLRQMGYAAPSTDLYLFFAEHA